MQLVNGKLQLKKAQCLIRYYLQGKFLKAYSQKASLYLRTIFDEEAPESTT